MVVTDAGGDHLRRLPFATEVTDPDQLTAELFGFVVRARERSGGDGVTSAERVMQEMSAIRTFLTHVVAVEDMHPHLRRITFGGGDLATFTPAGPDTFLYLLLPPPGPHRADHRPAFTWAAHAEMPEDERPVGAYYTLRRWRPEAQELDILCVLHGDAGPASAWAERARPATRRLWGPRTAYARRGHRLVPAGGRRDRASGGGGHPRVAPRGHDGPVFAEVDEAERQELPSPRRGHVAAPEAPAGTTTLLADAVRAMPWPGGTPYVWGGGEPGDDRGAQVRAPEVGLDRAGVAVAYWRHAAHAATPTTRVAVPRFPRSCAPWNRGQTPMRPQGPQMANVMPRLAWMLTNSVRAVGAERRPRRTRRRTGASRCC